MVIVAILVVASCSSSGSTASGPGTTTNVALLGPTNAATGSPVKLGYITEGKTASEDTTGGEAAANAAAKYVNEHLGGIHGHPIELEICHTQLTPAGSADCANQMIAAKVPVVLGATPAAAEPIITALSGAGIPYFVHTAVDPSVLLSPDAYVLANALGYLAAPIQIAKDAGVNKVAMILIDVPSAVGPIKAIGGPLFDKAGISVDYTAVAPGTPDMTPQIQAALGKGAQMFVVVGDPAFCTSGLGALYTLGFQGTKFVNSQCLSDDLATSVPGGLDGLLVGTAQSLDSSDPEVALYEVVMAQNAPGTPPHASANAEGYAAVLAFARGMTGLQGDMTPESVKSTLATAQPQQLPLLSGQTFQCNHKLFALTPAVCSTGIAVVKLNAEGKPTETKTIDVGPIVNG
jgi:branched-chain amino acid transport system substrate-binding protein